MKPLGSTVHHCTPLSSTVNDFYSLNLGKEPANSKVRAVE
jgi:hypothetical protein